MVDTLSRHAPKSKVDIFWNDVLEYLGPVEKSLARKIMAAIEEAKTGFNSELIAEYTLAGDYDRAITLALGGHMDDVSAFLALRVGVEEVALRTAVTITGRGIGIVQSPMARVTIDSLAPKTIDFIRREAMKAVQDITTNTRNGLRAILQDSMVKGKHAVVAARDMKLLLGLTERDALAVIRYREELEAKSRKALQRGLRDRRYDRSILNGNLPSERIDRMVEAYTKRLIAHRAETVALTEAARAFNVGQQLVWKSAVESLDVPADTARRFWLVAPGERTCTWCKEVARMNSEGVGLDEPFATPDGPYDLPPGHPRCRCAIVFRLV